MTLYAANAKGRLVGGSAVTQCVASCRVTAAGALSGEFGVASVVKSGTGVYDVTTDQVFLATTTMYPAPCRRDASAGMISAVPTSTNVVQVRTFNSAGAAVDAEFSLTVHGL